MKRFMGAAIARSVRSYRSLRDGSFRVVSLAVNCQATITQSLRDKNLLSPVHEIDSTPFFEAEDDDEYEHERQTRF